MKPGIIDLILKQRVFVVLLTLLITAAGLYSWRTLEIDAYPDVSNIQAMVLTEAPGFAASDVEQQVTYPIEWQMSGLPHVREVRSLSKAGLSQVVVVFEDYVDTYFSRQVVHERLQLAREILPQGMEPELGPISTGLGEIYQYTLESDDKSLMELRTLQDWLIAPQLRTIPGVTEVNSFGGFVKQYHVEVSPEKLLKFGVTLGDIMQAVKKNNANAPGKYIIKGWEQSYVRGVGLLRGIGDIESIVLESEDGTPVFLKDIADIRLGPETRQGAVTREGRGEVVAGMVIMLKGANSKNVVDAVKEKIPKIQATLAKLGVTINTFYDRTALIKACVDTVSKALLQGGLLVMAILFIFLWNLRAGVITTLALPLCVLLTFTVMKWQGISANLMSLGGLAIAIGMIVDSSIVVTENIMRHLSEKEGQTTGLAPVAAKATREVMGPIFFSTLIIIVVFLPLFTLEQTEGKMFKPLAVTICLALFAALLVGLVIVPVLCSLLLGRGERAKQNAAVRGITALYRPLLGAAMRNRAAVVAATILVFLLSLLLASRLGTEFMPALDEGSIAVNVVRLPSASLEGSTAVAGKLEREILKIPEVETVVSKTGRAEISEDPMGPEQNDIFIMLKHRKEWRAGVEKKDIVELVSKIIGKVPGLRPSFSQPIVLRMNELISGVRSDLAIKIFGDDLDILRETGVEVSNILADTDGARDVKMEQVAGFLQVNVQIDRAEIARHKINAEDINEIVETAVGGKVASWLLEGRKRFAILLRFPFEKRKDIRAIGSILVPSPKGHQVPLRQLTEITEEEGPAQISHEDNMRRIVVECNVRGRDMGSFVSEVREKLKSVEKSMPAGYFFKYGGQF
ncbi:MAG: CusA/CzcA family heavy metal efflux RND transporter, partial [Pseudomonadota bacterium]